MAKKQQQQQQQSQRKNEQQKRAVQKSGGMCSCLFYMIRMSIMLVALAAFAAVVTFVGHTYMVKQRLPTLDEFKMTSEVYLAAAKVHGNHYYGVVDKQTRVYYATFEKDYLPVIQKYTKEYTKLASTKFGEFRVIAAANLKIAQDKVMEMYNDYTKPQAPVAAPKPAAAKPAKSAEKPAPAKSAEKPRAAPSSTEKPKAQPTPKPTAAPAKATVKPAAKPAAAASKEKKEL